MAKFVIAYNRPQGRIEIFETYTDSADAVARRLELEAAYSGAEWEIALLASRSEETLGSTHSRCFTREASAA